MRVALVLAAAMLIGEAAQSEPRKTDTQGTPQKHTAPVILAAADTPRSPSPEESRPNIAPTKRRAGRITNCRCGDSQPENLTPEK